MTPLTRDDLLAMITPDELDAIARAVDPDFAARVSLANALIRVDPLVTASRLLDLAELCEAIGLERFGQALACIALAAAPVSEETDPEGEETDPEGEEFTLGDINSPDEGGGAGLGDVNDPTVGGRLADIKETKDA